MPTLKWIPVCVEFTTLWGPRKYDDKILKQLPLSTSQLPVTCHYHGGFRHSVPSCRQMLGDIFFLHSCARRIRAVTYNEDEWALVAHVHLGMSIWGFESEI